MSLNVFPQAPYFDDFDESKNYLRVLFRPGVSLQVRELNQLQTYLQSQIDRFGTHMFKDGAMVIPGQSSVDTTVTYLKIESDTNGENVDSFLEDLVGSTLVGQTSGVEAQVITFSRQTNEDPITLFVRYTKSGTTTSDKTFSLSELLETADGTTVSGNDRTVQISLASGSIGQGSISSIQPGIYFIKGQFVRVGEQTIILDKYSNTPSYRIGLDIEENVITANEDSTLNDNANGTPNENAPGAHRYQIVLTLTKLDLDAITDNTFIELIRVSNGLLQLKVETTDYAQLAKTLARRTFDESGNYTVTPFKTSTREHRNNNRGAWQTSKVYQIGDIVTSGGNYFTAINSGTSGPIEPSTVFVATNPYQTFNDGIVNWNFTPNPSFNRGLYTPELGGDETKFALAIEPGKGYVQGYEIQKSSTEYVEVDKARDYDRITSDSIPVRYGNFIYVTNIRGLTDCSNYPTIDLFNEFTGSSNQQTAGAGTKVGTARIRAVEFDSGTPGNSGIYKAYLFNVQMNAGYTFERDVKQIFFSTLGTTIDRLVADVADVYNIYPQLSGTISASDTTVTGTGTSFNFQLKVGDYISAESSTGIETRKVTEIASNVSCTINSAFSGTVTGKTVRRVQAQVQEPSGMQLMFPLAYSFIRSVRGGTNDTSFDTAYTTTQRFEGTASSTTLSINVGSAVGATTLGTEFNPSANKNEFTVCDRTSGTPINPTSIVLSNNGQTATISGVTSGRQYVIMAPVRKSGAAGQEKQKTLVTNQIKDYADEDLVKSTTLSIGKADVYKIVSVRMANPGEWTASSNPDITKDITDWFDFDDGQRDTHYDVATLTRKEGYPVPTGAVRIIFDYFSHSDGTAGDYFTVNSYSDVQYKDIPYFISTNGVQALADVIDFRPRIDDEGAGFSSASASRTELPKIGFETTTSYSYYLPRKDKLAIDIDGKFFAINGIASLDPQDPKDPVLGMLLSKITIAPFTENAAGGSVIIDNMDTKRYTMRDIGKLDKRIENLEYYTALSLLEADTKTMSIRDEFGLDRFKRGFVVDSFKGQDVGDVGSLDYRCAIDMNAQELRPFYSMNNVNLIEENQEAAQRSAAGYALTGDIITLPYTHEKFIEQPFASTTENVNPFAIFTFLGGISLNPPADEWFEVNRRPDIVNNIEGNFSAVQTALERAGALGTVWNAWETQWTGTSYKVDRTFVTDAWDTTDYGLGAGKWSSRGSFTAAELQAIGGDSAGVGKRVITFQKDATPVIQNRVGVTTSVIPKIDYEVVEDRILQSAVIPYIRSRELLFVCGGMKPNTLLYPFFDDTSISDFVTPATRISVTKVSNSVAFDSQTNVGGAAQEFARQVDGKAEMSYNKGDVLYVKQRGSTTFNSQAVSVGTAVVVLTDKTIDGVESVYVLNVKGAFQAGDIVQGSISGATYTIDSAVTVAQVGDEIITNFNGSVAGVFSIPNTDSVRFRTGIRDFKLTDSQTGTLDFTTQGRVQYRAQGVLETRQKTVNAVRNSEIALNEVSETRSNTIYSDERTIRDTGWYDPLAQTFFVRSKGGTFITKVDVFFATKDINVPVRLQIREVVNGYPGQQILPFSKVSLTPDKVNISTDGVNPDVDGIPLATTFTFESPVYLMDNTEYCIVLLSDSNNYRVWISNLGDKSVGTDRFISEQPYAGVLFKSQNASTWTANQEQDLKFTLYRAKFNTNTLAVIPFVNEPLPPLFLRNDPFRTTTGSGKVRVMHQNHGMPNGSTVIISNVEPATYNGIVTTDTTGLNGQFVISNVEFDSYVITVAGVTATATGFVGGEDIIVTQNAAYDVADVITQSHTFSDTRLGFSMLACDTNYQLSTEETMIVPNESVYFSSPKQVASQINENVKLGGLKSLRVLARMTTTNDAISPVIDTARLSMTTVKNRIDNATESMKNVAVIDDLLILDAIDDVGFAGSTISIPEEAQSNVTSVVIGKYITISGTSSNDTVQPLLVTAVANDGSSITVDGTLATETSTATIIMKDNFVSEIAPSNGSAVAKYLTRVINLQESSTFLKIMFAANIPANTFADVEVWYKLLPTGSNGDISQYNFVRANTPVREVVKTSNPGEFRDVQYDLNDLPAYDAVVVKLVMKSDNTSLVPRVKDLRIIACA